MQLKVKKVHPDAILPKYATAGAACFDLYSVDEGTVMPNCPLQFETGWYVEVPQGHVLLIYSRSGHGFNNAVRLSNAVGVIDSDYRGPLKVSLHNDGYLQKDFRVYAGDRIAQAMLVPIPRVELIEVEKLSDTVRGTGGMGSTGR